ncbi:MAG: hypothetical protein E7052_11110, partial [Lentisphaerae bacterium]|nr:hypothetical protein [Lentisphaerota bacterium]
MENIDNNLSADKEKQIVYLDFDGAETSYDGELLKVENVAVSNSELSAERIKNITDQLNYLYKLDDVFFVFSEPVETSEYSTIYIGNTTAFDEYGDFYGLAETIDTGNQIKNDNAFVLLDNSSSNEHIISVIAHETDHIVKGREHAENSNSIADYAMDKLIKTETDTCEVIVQRSGGFYPGSPYVTDDYWYASLPAGATKAVITITNDGISKSHGWSRCDTTIYVTVNGFEYLIGEGSSKTFTIESNASFSFSRDASLDLEVAYTDYIYDTLRPHIIVGYRYSYYSGYVQNKVTITAQYYNDIPTADLVVDSAQLSKSSKYTLRIDPSESFTYTFTVKNSGDLAAAASTATIYLDGKKLTDIAVKALSAGASGTYSYTFKPGSLTNGSHSVYVAVDTAGTIAEFSESNNSSSTSSFIIEPAMADLAIKNLTVADAENSSILATDKDIKISFELENRSENKASTAVTAELYAGDKLIKTFTVPALAIDKSTTLTHTIAAGTLPAGSAQFKVVVDSANVCKEFDESNNTSTVTQTVNAPILPDLKVNSITLTNPDGGNMIYADKPVTVTIEVENASNGLAELLRDSAATELELQFDGIGVKRVSIPSLSAGKSYTAEITVPAGILTEYCGVEVTAVIDPDNKCVESEENNNTSSKEIAKAEYDLVFSDPQCSIDGKNYEAVTSFTVTNNSNVWSEQQTVFIESYLGILWDVEIEALAPGASKTYEIKREYIPLDDTATPTLYLGFDHKESSGLLKRDALSFSATKISDVPDIKVTEISTVWTVDRLFYKFSSTFENTEYYIIPFIDYVKYPAVVTSECEGYLTLDRISKNCASSIMVYAVNGKEYDTAYNSICRTYMGGWYQISVLKENWTLEVISADISYRSDGMQELTFEIDKSGDNAWRYGCSAVLKDANGFILSVYLPYVGLEETRTVSCLIPSGKTLLAGTHDLTLLIYESYESELKSEFNFTVTIDAPPQLPETEDKSTLPVIVASSSLSNDKSSAAVQAAFSDDDSITLKQYSVDLENWKTYTGAVNVDKNGTVYFKAVDTLGNVAIEACEVSGIVYRYADLQISSISTNVNTVNTKQPLTLNFTVKNAGDTASTAATAYIYDGTTKLGEVAIGALAVGGTFNGSFTIAAGKLALGAHTLKIVADGANIVAESNENNNAAEHSVTVVPPTAPDLTITALSGEVNGNQTQITVTVANKGDAASDASLIYLYENGIKKTVLDVKALAVGTEVKISFAFNHSGSSYTLKAVVDPTDIVAESNENNNSATTQVTFDDLEYFKSGKLAQTALTNSEDGKSGSAKLTGFVGKGDAEDYFHVVGSGPAHNTISISGLDCKAKVTLYDANKKKIKTYSLKGNGTIYTGYLPGDYYVAVTSADKGKGKYNTNYSVNINAIYAPGDAVKNNSFNEAAASASKLATANTLSGWVGMGDIADYYKFTNVSGEKLSFTVTGVTAKLKLTVYDRNLKKVKSVSIKKNGTYLTNLLVNGDFFVAVESADKGKKQHSNYNISVKADIFPVEAKFNNDRSHASNLAQSGNGVV